MWHYFCETLNRLSHGDITDKKKRTNSYRKVDIVTLLSADKFRVSLHLRVKLGRSTYQSLQSASPPHQCTLVLLRELKPHLDHHLAF